MAVLATKAPASMDIVGYRQRRSAQVCVIGERRMAIDATITDLGDRGLSGRERDDGNCRNNQAEPTAMVSSQSHDQSMYARIVNTMMYAITTQPMADIQALRSSRAARRSRNGTRMRSNPPIENPMMPSSSPLMNNT